MRQRLLSAILLSGLAILTGCAEPKQAVYVNREKALSREIAAGAFSAPSWTPEQLGAKLDWPALESREYGNEITRRRVAEAKRLIDDNRVSAIKNLQRSLYASLMREIERERASREDELDAKIREAIDEATLEISGVFEAYANERAPVVTRLSYFVGYPFPPVASIPDAPEDAPLRLKQTEETRRLYAKLAELERTFAAELKTINDELFKKIGADRVQFGLAVSSRMDEIQRQAQSEAESALAQANAEIDLSLIQEESLRLPPSSALSSQVSGSARAFERRAEPVPQAIISKRAELETDVVVWAGVRMFRIVDDPKLGEDKTEEFIAWRKTHPNGP